MLQDRMHKKDQLYRLHEEEDHKRILREEESLCSMHADEQVQAAQCESTQCKEK